MPRVQSKPDCDDGKCKPEKRRIVLDAPEIGCYDDCKTVTVKGDKITIKSVKRHVKQDTIKVRPAPLDLVIEQPDFKIPKDKLKLRIKREKVCVKQGKVELDVCPPNVHVKEQQIRVLVKRGKCEKRCKPEVEVVCDKPEVICIEPEVCVRKVGKPKVTCCPPNVCVEYVDCWDNKKPKKKDNHKKKYETEEEDAELWEGDEASE